MRRRGGARGIVVMVAVMALLANVMPLLAMEESGAVPSAAGLLPTATASAIDWLEPRGLSIVDLVGIVPENYLVGSILSYTPGYGILRYKSGQRTGDTVVITADVYPRFVIDGSWTGTMFGCLGQPARIDQFGTVSPASTVRVYNGAAEVTRQIDLYTYVPAGLNKPIRNPKVSEWQNQYRYWESDLLRSQFTAEGALVVPANMGCEIIMSNKNYRQLTAVFTLQAPQVISVEVLSAETFTFHSYVGVGYAGLLAPLVNQLRARFGDRHERFELHAPAEADYLWLNFPPMPVDMYTQFPGNPTGNVDRPTGGTYRMDTSEGLSVDHVSSMGLPLRGHWKDMDLAGGTAYLPYMRGVSMAAPEYFVPAGVAYNLCMIQGNCSPDLLDQIYNTPMTMQVIYLKVERVAYLQMVPLRMVGPSWEPTTMAATEVESLETVPKNDALDAAEPFFYFIFLPMTARNYCQLLPDSACTDGPCGWMTTDGRMVDFVP